MRHQLDIGQLLSELDGGVFAQKIARALADTAANVVHTGKKGKVTITFDLKRIAESHQVEVNHTVKFAKPTEKGSVVEDNSTKTPLYVGSNGYIGIMPQAQMALEGLTRHQREEA